VEVGTVEVNIPSGRKRGIYIYKLSARVREAHRAEDFSRTSVYELLLTRQIGNRCREHAMLSTQSATRDETSPQHTASLHLVVSETGNGCYELAMIRTQPATLHYPMTWSTFLSPKKRHHN
jgi:hypothetical protein